MSFKHTLGEYFTYPKLFGKLYQVNRGIRFSRHAYGDNKDQYIAVFDPAGHGRDTVVVYIHGGGWRQGSPAAFRYIGQKFADLGYRSVLLGYRHAPKYKYPSQAEDVFSGLCKYIELQKDMGADVSNIVVVGSSAGAHLGAVLVYDRTLQEKYNIPQHMFKGFISLGGPLVFEECRGRTITILLNSLFPGNYARATGDPYSLIRGDEEIPVLCIQAERDPFISTENSIRFAERINSFKPGLAKCHIVKDKGMFHSNLVAGIFMDDNPIAEMVYNWIEGLQAAKNSA